MADYKIPIITGTALAVGDILRWDGSDWVNYPDDNYGSAGGLDLLDGGSSNVLLDTLVFDAKSTAISDVAMGEYTDEDDDDVVMEASHAYLANQDGVVNVVGIRTGINTNVTCYVDTDNNPVAGGDILARWNEGTTTGQINTLTFRVPKGKYFEVTATNATVVIWWQPSGTLIKCTDQD